MAELRPQWVRARGEAVSISWGWRPEIHQLQWQLSRWPLGGLIPQSYS